MRKVSIPRIILLAVLLLLVAITANLNTRKLQQASKEPLNNALASLPGWNATSSVPMGAEIEETLKLDDYLFRTYKRGNEAVTLYIGYYRSAAKVGAAHDPLVCFTGQGWHIVNRGTGKHHLPGPDNFTINYSTMVAEQQSDKELIIYWFQTNGTTSAGTLEQKINMLKQRLRNVPKEENAFVRVSISMKGESPEAAKKSILDFVNTFYPKFYRYVGR